MSQPPPHASSPSRGRHFDRTIIILRVRWYITYKLSYRDLVEIWPSAGSTSPIRQSSAGPNATSRSSRGEGTATPDPSAPHGAWARRTSEPEGGGLPCTVPPIGRDSRPISR